jgi:hypothetical protein
MQFADRLVISIARPVYYAFFARPLWWFLAKVKAFFFAETTVALENIERRLREDQQQQRWAAIEERLRSLEMNNAAQWDAMEQLLLSLFRQSEAQSAQSEWKFSIPSDAATSTTTADLNRVHAAGNLR